MLNFPDKTLWQCETIINTTDLFNPTYMFCTRLELTQAPLSLPGQREASTPTILDKCKNLQMNFEQLMYVPVHAQHLSISQRFV